MKKRPKVDGPCSMYSFVDCDRCEHECALLPQWLKDFWKNLNKGEQR